MHKDWYDTTGVRCDTAVVSKKYLLIAGEGLKVDLMISECASAIDTASECKSCKSTGSVSAIVENDIYRRVNRIHGHPGKKLDLPIFYGVVVDTRWCGPCCSAIRR